MPFRTLETLNARTLERSSKRRPSYPSPGRQFFGVFLTVFSIALLQVLISNHVKMDNPGSVLLLVVMFVTYWSGLRAGMISTGLTLAYLLFVYSKPGTLFVYTHLMWNRIVAGWIVIPAFVLIVGGIQNKLRKGAIRAYDAQAAADQAEEALVQSKQLQRQVVDAAMEAIVAIRQDGSIMLWNRAAESMMGWKSDDVLGKTLDEVMVPPDYKRAYYSAMQRYTESGKSTILGRPIELRSMSKERGEFPVEATIVPHETEDGVIFIAFVRDITEQKALNERLRQAQKMEAIGTLAGGIAHDFNNILTAVSGNLALAKADVPPGSPALESLTEAEKAVARAGNVVRQILTFSSPQKSPGGLIDVGDTLAEAMGLLKATLPATIETSLCVDPDLAPIRADGADIHQIVLNLGINALHAMHGGHGGFKVEAAAVALDDIEAESLRVPPGKYVRVDVSDTGMGMDARTLERLFEPFFTTKKPGEGTGLGLSVVYGIVERCKGAISVYSEPGAGSVFHIYLPAAEGTPVRQSRKPVATPEGHGERILYVDDDESLVLLMRRLLTRLNYRVSGYQSSLEALEAFRADPDAFDVVVTDMSMPQIDGPTLVRELQLIRPSVPIVMVTGYIRPTDLEQASDLGIRKLILKPNSVDDMAETLQGILAELPASPFVVQ